MVINHVLNTGIFPDKLTIAKVIPIFKKDDLILFKHFRSISLLPTISKVLEKTIFIQFSSYINEAQLVSITIMLSHANIIVVFNIMSNNIYDIDHIDCIDCRIDVNKNADT